MSAGNGNAATALAEILRQQIQGDNFTPIGQSLISGLSISYTANRAAIIINKLNSQRIILYPACKSRYPKLLLQFIQVSLWDNFPVGRLPA